MEQIIKNLKRELDNLFGDLYSAQHPSTKREYNSIEETKDILLCALLQKEISNLEATIKQLEIIRQNWY